MGYKGPCEQTKYDHALELLPTAPIRRALEIGCSQRLFTEKLWASRWADLGVDISARARSRGSGVADLPPCRRTRGLSPTESRKGLSISLPGRSALKKLIHQITQSLRPNGYFLIANHNSVNDDRTVTGFDFSEIGAVFIGQAFSRGRGGFPREVRAEPTEIRKSRSAS